MIPAEAEGVQWALNQSLLIGQIGDIKKINKYL